MDKRAQKCILSAMSTLSYEEVEQLLRLAKDATTGATFEERLKAITDCLLVLIPSTSLTVTVERNDGRPGHHFSRNVEPDVLRRYADQYRAVDPMRPVMASKLGEPVALSDVVLAENFGRDPFTADFLGPRDIRYVLGVALLVGADRMIVELEREGPLGDFTAKERELLRLATPDIGRAAFASLMRTRVEDLLANSGNTINEPANGLVVFDSVGDLIHADAGALALLRQVDSNQFDALASEVRRLARTNSNVASTFERSFPLGDRRLRVSASAVEKPERQIIVQLNVDRTLANGLEQLSTRARLSQRESDVVSLVVEGLGNRAIGHKLGMSEITVGTHLTSVYRKTGVAGRTDLVRLLFSGGVTPKRSSVEENRQNDFLVEFDPALSPEEIRVSLTALADYYRACGGIGLKVDVDLQGVGRRAQVIDHE